MSGLTIYSKAFLVKKVQFSSVLPICENHPPLASSLLKAFNPWTVDFGDTIFLCIFLCRLNLAFTYYGIVLMTTELYQGLNEAGGKCQGKRI